MKRIISIILLFLLTLLTFAGCVSQKTVELTSDSKSNSETESGADGTPRESGGVIVVYFSRTGNTRPLAEYIKDELNADIYEIEAKVPYTEDDIKYYTDCRADREQNDRSARPEIAGELPDFSKYNTIYLGYPIWHGQAPKIIYTFLESINTGGKTIIPFCTSASSPIGSSAVNLHSLAADAQWKEGRRFAPGTTREAIKDWLTTMNAQKELKLFINDSEIPVKWESNASVEALKELAAREITVAMSMYGGFEQVGALGTSLPRNDEEMTANYGDIVLYSGNQIVLFFGSNSWAYTRLGHMNLSKENITELLSHNEIIITIKYQ